MLTSENYLNDMVHFYEVSGRSVVIFFHALKNYFSSFFLAMSQEPPRTFSHKPATETFIRLRIQEKKKKKRIPI